MLNFKMKPVNSSNLSAVGYDEESKTLRVTFHNGSTYDYSGVPKETYENLLRADSIGSFFRANVRSEFSYTKL